MSVNDGIFEVQALAVNGEGMVFPGRAPGAPVYRDGHQLRVRTGSTSISMTDLWAKAGIEEGIHIVHEETLLANYRRIKELFEGAFPNRLTVAWAVKSFPVKGIVQALAKEGAGADAGSVQELRLALESGIESHSIICTGVAKGAIELGLIAECGATSVLDNLDEARALNELGARFGKKISVGVRINPEVDVPSHDMIATGALGSKFGVPIGQAEEFCEALGRLENLELSLVHMHVGSHFYQIDPVKFSGAVNRQAELVRRLRKHYPIRRIDIGGGFRFPFVSPAQAEQLGMHGEAFRLVTRPDLLEASVELMREHVTALDPDLELIIEPGTSVVAGANFSLGQVVAVRDSGTFTSRIDGKTLPAGWILCSVPSSEFILRAAVPNLYFQTCLVEKADAENFAAGVAGPLCFAGDILSPPKSYLRMGKPERGDLIYFGNTGAYIGCGCNFHNLPRFPIALLGREGELRLVRRREPENPMARVDDFDGA